MPSGKYKLSNIWMTDIALNSINVYFTGGTDSEKTSNNRDKNANPDFDPPVVDINNIRIKAEPTHPDDPNGETLVDITFYMKDNISGYALGSMKSNRPAGCFTSFLALSRWGR